MRHARRTTEEDASIYDIVSTMFSRIAIVNRRVNSALSGPGRFALRSLSGDSSHDDFAPKKKAPEPLEMDDVKAMIQNQIAENDIMLYMKGTPSSPQCGFSGQSVRMLHALGVDFSSVNVLEYPMIREGVKQYSQWPTIPQLYVKGEFIGGCEIMTNMFSDGELETLLKDEGLIEK